MSEEQLTCPVTPLATLLGSKWTVEIFRELAIKPTRTRRFLLHIPGLSMKCLRQRLKQLEEAGLVRRFQYSQRPLKVEYTLTERGRRFAKLFDELKALAEEEYTPMCVCPLESKCTSETMNCPKRRSARRGRSN